MVVRIDLVRHSPLRQFVEYRRRASDPTGLVDIFLLDPIKPRQKTRAHAALEQWPKSEYAPSHDLHQFSAHPVVEDRARKPAKSFEPAERRRFGIEVKQVPMAVLCRRTSGEQSGNCSRAEAQHGLYRLAVRKQIVQ